MKVTKGDKIIIAVFFIIIQIVCLWCVDISVSAMLANGVVTNGFLINNPTQMYHIGLYVSIISSFCIFILFVHIILGEEKKNGKGN